MKEKESEAKAKSNTPAGNTVGGAEAPGHCIRRPGTCGTDRALAQSTKGDCEDAWDAAMLLQAMGHLRLSECPGTLAEASRGLKGLLRGESDLNKEGVHRKARGAQA